MINGIEGFLADHTMDMAPLKENGELERIRTTPGSYLGSCRYKLPDSLEDPVYPKLFQKFQEMNIGWFFYIGGNDSMDTIKKLSDYAILTGQTQKFLGVPKTIDNDLALTDHTPGFGSAAKYIGASTKEVIRDALGLTYKKEMITIIEVMGRTAGHIALWCGISNGSEYVLIPERAEENDEEEIIKKIMSKRRIGKKHHIIVNAEGVGHSHEMAKRIEAATGIETRATVIGHIQRGGNPSCRDRVYASAMGARAVDLLLKGQTNRVVAYKNGEFTDFDIDYALQMTKDIDEHLYSMTKRLSR